MTVRELLTESAKLGIRLRAEADKVRYEAPRGAMTGAIRDALVLHKAAVLAVLWRLEEMRRLAAVAPQAVVYARESACGGPGRCFSCAEALSLPDAYGRCTPCNIAADVYYALQPDEAQARKVVA